MNDKNTIGIIGDMHFKEALGYADYVDDRRLSEKKDVLSFIVQAFKDCSSVVFLGDQLNARNNTSEVIKDFVWFVEQFGDKELHLLVGNHEKRGSGKSAIDFMKEIKRPNWHVYSTPEVANISGVKSMMLPYMMNGELGVADTKEAQDVVLKSLKPATVLFCHHAISDTLAGMVSTNTFPEVILPKSDMEQVYKLVIGGHIHDPKEYGTTIVSGSVFNNEVGEEGKFIWKLNASTLKVEKIPLPGRAIFKLENPQTAELEALPESSIVKVIITDKETDIEELKKTLARFDAYVLVEQYKNTRTKVHFDSGAIDLSIDGLLKLYSDSKSISLDSLRRGLDLITK